MPKDFEEFGVLDHIDRLSSAEEIFTYLLLPYDEQVMRTSRLHIMKRFGSYLSAVVNEGQDEAALFIEARACLKHAYNDFCESTPIKERVFKVFRDQDERAKAKFVSIDALNTPNS